MTGRGKKQLVNPDPDFSPEGRVEQSLSQRMLRLQRRANRRRDYKRMHEGLSSEEELSDTCSAVASDDTTSSVGRAKESFAITPDQLAQILQEALAKQHEEIRAEIKTEMELTMQQVRDLQAEQQPESSQKAESRKRNARPIRTTEDDDEEDETIFADPPPDKDNSGSGPAKSSTQPPQIYLKKSEEEDKKMQDLESKVNALMTAQEVKKTGIPYPYPREWDLIPYPLKFNLINFTPFDGRGSPTQHLIYFKSHLGVISGNETLMVRSFVGTLRGPAFDWY